MLESHSRAVKMRIFA